MTKKIAMSYREAFILLVTVLSKYDVLTMINDLDQAASLVPTLRAIYNCEFHDEFTTFTASSLKRFEMRSALETIDNSIHPSDPGYSQNFKNTVQLVLQKLK